MVSFITRIRRRFTGGDTIIECQSCGTKLDGDGTVCPECGSEDISTYELN